VVAEPFTCRRHAGNHRLLPGFKRATRPAGGNTAVVRGPFDIFGGSSGAGDLSIVATQNAATAVRSIPLNHQGGVKLSSGLTTRQFANLRSTTISWSTEIINVQLEVATANGLAVSAAGTTVSSNGLLRLHGGSQESVSVTDSTLALWSAETTLTELRPAATQVEEQTLTTYGQFRGAATMSSSNRSSSRRLEYDLYRARRIDACRRYLRHRNLLLNPSSSWPINVTAPIQNDSSRAARRAVALLAQDVFQGELFLRNGGQLVVETNQHMSRVRTGALVTNGMLQPICSIEVRGRLH